MSFPWFLLGDFPTSPGVASFDPPRLHGHRLGPLRACAGAHPAALLHLGTSQEGHIPGVGREFGVDFTHKTGDFMGLHGI